MNKPDKIWAWQGTDPLTDIKWGAGEWYTEDVGLDGDEVKYLLATPERELASELVEALRDFLEKVTDIRGVDIEEDYAPAQIEKARAVLAKLDKGE